MRPWRRAAFLACNVLSLRRGGRLGYVPRAGDASHVGATFVFPRATAADEDETEVKAPKEASLRGRALAIRIRSGDSDLWRYRRSSRRVVRPRRALRSAFSTGALRALLRSPRVASLSSSWTQMRAEGPQHPRRHAGSTRAVGETLTLSRLTATLTCPIASWRRLAPRLAARVTQDFQSSSPPPARRAPVRKTAAAPAGMSNYLACPELGRTPRACSDLGLRARDVRASSPSAAPLSKPLVRSRETTASPAQRGPCVDETVSATADRVPNNNRRGSCKHRGVGLQV